MIGEPGVSSVHALSTVKTSRARSPLVRTWCVALVATALCVPIANGQRPESIPLVDRTKHSVPLEEIYFDTFRRTGNRAVALTLAEPELIERLLDAIPPLHHPRYQTAGEAGWLGDNDLVIGYAAADSAWAFPIRILNSHEIVNDTLGGEPVLVSFCPLCNSGVVYSRRLGGRELVFGNTSALYESDMVMVDYGTGSYWWQVAGEAIVGTLTGSKLRVLPATTARWGDWRAAHRETMVLSRETGFKRNYDSDRYAPLADRANRGEFTFPVSGKSRDSRLAAGSVVIGLRRRDEVRAYRVDSGRAAVMMDRLGGEDVVVFTDGVGGGAAFAPSAGGRRLQFRMQGGQIRDRETNSVWDLAGRAVSGALQGAQLEQLPTKRSFWFAMIATEPSITVYSGQQ